MPSENNIIVLHSAKMLFPHSVIKIDRLEEELFVKKQVSLSVLRLDAIHAVISGNKLFKLHYFLEIAQEQGNAGIITFGGAYSNHLVATAYACKKSGIRSIGIVRGEKPMQLSHTLINCMDYGMQLQFISRGEYRHKTTPGSVAGYEELFPGYLVVPEGGYHPRGASGAALIMNYVPAEISHIACAAGTATTLSGLLMGAGRHQKIIGFPVLKGITDLSQRISHLTGRVYSSEQLQVMDGYHFDGYAKKTPELVNFMNRLYETHRLPTDFIYTGKMMFGIYDCIRNDLFEKGSNILCLHTGGLQGNLSLAPGALVF